MNKQSTAGNRGPGIKSDCFVELELLPYGGIQIELKSKVKALYGESIERLANDILNVFGIKNARLSIEDTGALEIIIAARIEAAIKKIVETDLEYLFPVKDQFPAHLHRRMKNERHQAIFQNQNPRYRHEQIHN